ncbi:MAG: hypothetical protein A2W90_15900 [Bacteroidetes bacterium GWF2_42_66]|nr:MAG: hypothetical protein A2W92_08575 [Bacteroidetes bacterium GWA2_42_15]OFX96190.1 MAG: hypothetical protein A2W89_04830 [Bacteroidetes bacterium GWE2_42_39]OFY46229.1 MAG: hypothetical protein A2W90_15900 [Bacteroidetes bacterium GWF2_42_66]HAZ01686.1 hypothetical protein [Marinilabiliales bacterium]HBL78402.1 hypothetical protein [Prolixibacteraceae bacterium]
MKIVVSFWLFIVTVLFFVSCEDIPEYNNSKPLAVVEAYLFNQQPITDIVLKKVTPFEGGDQVDYISDANLYLQTGEHEFLLNPVEGKEGHYSYQGDDLQVTIGNTYKLFFDYDGKQVWGETVVPAEPENLSLSENEIYITQLVDLSDASDFLNDINQSLTLEWENSTSDYYYITIENLEENPEPMELSDKVDLNFEFVSRPVQDNYFLIRPVIHFLNYGTHKLTLYHVNKEYALMYESLNQDSRNLNEPYTNINNGVGIFSAFASKTILFEVKKR